MRLQEANDRGDLSALRDMMTPGLFKEIEAQVRERGGAGRRRTSVTLDSKVALEVVTEGDHYVASVRFTGMIKEDAAQPEHFSEVWHLQKPVNGSSGWLMAAYNRTSLAVVFAAGPVNHVLRGESWALRRLQPVRRTHGCLRSSPLLLQSDRSRRRRGCFSRAGSRS